MLTTWGKWDEVRKKIRATLLENNEITIEEDALDKLLLGDVINTMLAESREYVNGRIEQYRANKRQVTLDSFSVSLGALVKVLKEKLSLSNEQTNQYIMPAIELANSISLELIESLIELGGYGLMAKTDVFLKKYGQDFNQKYPQLKDGIYLYDMDLIQDIRNDILSKASELSKRENTINQIRLEEHARFMGEIIDQKEPNLAFEAKFKQETGKTMQEYKNDIGVQSAINFSVV